MSASASSSTPIDEEILALASSRSADPVAFDALIASGGLGLPLLWSLLCDHKNLPWGAFSNLPSQTTSSSSPSSSSSSNVVVDMFLGLLRATEKYCETAPHGYLLVPAIAMSLVELGTGHRWFSDIASTPSSSLSSSTTSTTSGTSDANSTEASALLLRLTGSALGRVWEEYMQILEPQAASRTSNSSVPSSSSSSSSSIFDFDSIVYTSFQTYTSQLPFSERTAMKELYDLSKQLNSTATTPAASLPKTTSLTFDIMQHSPDDAFKLLQEALSATQRASIRMCGAAIQEVEVEEKERANKDSSTTTLAIMTNTPKENSGSAKKKNSKSKNNKESAATILPTSPAVISSTPTPPPVSTTFPLVIAGIRNNTTTNHILADTSLSSSQQLQLFPTSFLDLVYAQILFSLSAYMKKEGINHHTSTGNSSSASRTMELGKLYASLTQLWIGHSTMAISHPVLRHFELETAAIRSTITTAKTSISLSSLPSCWVFQVKLSPITLFSVPGLPTATRSLISRLRSSRYQYALRILQANTSPSSSIPVLHQQQQQKQQSEEKGEQAPQLFWTPSLKWDTFESVVRSMYASRGAILTAPPPPPPPPPSTPASSSLSSPSSKTNHKDQQDQGVDLRQKNIQFISNTARGLFGDVFPSTTTTTTATAEEDESLVLSENDQQWVENHTDDLLPFPSATTTTNTSTFPSPSVVSAIGHITHLLATSMCENPDAETQVDNTYDDRITNISSNTNSTGLELYSAAYRWLVEICLVLPSVTDKSSRIPSSMFTVLQDFLRKWEECASVYANTLDEVAQIRWFAHDLRDPTMITGRSGTASITTNPTDHVSSSSSLSRGAETIAGVKDQYRAAARAALTKALVMLIAEEKKQKEIANAATKAAEAAASASAKAALLASTKSNSGSTNSSSSNNNSNTPAGKSGAKKGSSKKDGKGKGMQRNAATPPPPPLPPSAASPPGPPTISTSSSTSTTSSTASTTTTLPLATEPLPPIPPAPAILALPSVITIARQASLEACYGKPPGLPLALPYPIPQEVEEEAEAELGAEKEAEEPKSEEVGTEAKNIAKRESDHQQQQQVSSLSFDKVKQLLPTMLSLAAPAPYQQQQQQRRRGGGGGGNNSARYGTGPAASFLASLSPQIQAALPAAPLLRSTRPNFFLSLRITDPDVRAAIGSVQSKFLAFYPSLKSCQIEPNDFHITMAVLVLPDPASIERAKVILQSCVQHTTAVYGANSSRSSSSSTFSDTRSMLTVSGIDVFNNKVLFAKPHQDIEYAKMIELSHRLHAAFSQEKLTLEACDAEAKIEYKKAMNEWKATVSNSLSSSSSSMQGTEASTFLMLASVGNQGGGGSSSNSSSSNRLNNAGGGISSSYQTGDGRKETQRSGSDEKGDGDDEEEDRAETDAEDDDEDDDNDFIAAGNDDLLSIDVDELIASSGGLPFPSSVSSSSTTTRAPSNSANAYNKSSSSSSSSLLKAASRRDSFHPHITLFKLSKQIRMNKGGKGGRRGGGGGGGLRTIPKDAWKPFSDVYFGQSLVSCIELSEMGSRDRIPEAEGGGGGYYRCHGRLSIYTTSTAAASSVSVSGAGGGGGEGELTYDDI